MKEKTSRNKSQLLPPMDFNRRNLMWFAVGLAVLVVGYLLMSIGPWDNPLSRTVSPLVLLVAYLIIFPLAILGGSKMKSGQKQDK